MSGLSKRKTSLTLDAETLSAARALGLNVSAVAQAALQHAVAQARQRRWLEENADAFAAQSAWHDHNGHPLADILTSPTGTTWRR